MALPAARELWFMTADERNRRLKYGTDVPRWWIPDFNRPPEPPSRQERAGRSGQPSAEGAASDDYQVFERRRRQLLRREQARRINRTVRILQLVIALLIAALAFLAAGVVGLAIGAVFGLLLLSFRFER